MMLTIRQWLGMAACCLIGLSVTAAEPVLKVGDAVPDFTAMSLSGKPVRFSELTAAKPTVLVFSRAHWCPYCMGHMQALQKQLAEFESAGAQVVAVFRENTEGVAGLKKVQMASKAEFLLLDDPKGEHTKPYSPEGYDAYVVDQAGKIRVVIDGTKTGRPAPEKLLQAVKELQ
ncbi:redoxin domain-containing protein [bacterium]|nr:redoxin domain-containing protein [bacterium]